MRSALLSLLAAVSAYGITVSSPNTTAVVTTPVHFVASAEGAKAWVITTSEGRPVFKTANAALEDWVLLPEAQQTVIVTAMNESGAPIGSARLDINVHGVAAPKPPARSHVYELTRKHWRAIQKNLGGDYWNASIQPFKNPPPDVPNGATTGIHMRVVSPKNEPSTNGLIEWTHRIPKDDLPPLNALWSFWFAVPAPSHDVQAYESDLVIVANVKGAHLGGRRIFEFNTQYSCCGPNKRDWIWQSWRKNCEIPNRNPLCSNWVPLPHITTGKPFAPDRWHKLTIFGQRVTRDGTAVYQSVPAAGQADTNASLLYAVVIFDDDAMLWNIVENSLASENAPLIHVQDQVDTARAGKIVDKWIVGQTLTTW